MSLIFPIIFSFLLNFSFAQGDIQIEFNNTNCEGTNSYYNSLEYQCRVCNGTKGYYSDTCYSIENPRSIYTFNTFQNIILNCKYDEVFSELDEDQNLLETPQCSNKIFNFTDITVNGNYTPITYEGGDLSIRYNDEFLYTFNSSEEYNYYRYSCLNGKSERSCDFMANLYALSLYSNNNIEVQIINALNDLLHDKSIL